MVGCKVLEIVERDGLVARADVMGVHLRAGLAAIAAEFACIGDIRGQGLLIGMELTGAEGLSAAQLSDAVTDRALELGLSANIVRVGTSGGVMRIAPPLTITAEELDFGVSLLRQAIHDTTRLRLPRAAE